MYYPVNLDIKGKRCLVVGGGEVAYQKVKGLLRAGAKVTVVAPRLVARLSAMKRSGKIQWLARSFQKKILRGYFLAIVATDDREVNSEIGRLCREKNILVNVVDQPVDCSFTVPSLLRRGSLMIAISTNGASPALSKAIRKDLESRYGADFGEFLSLMGSLRQEAIERIPEQPLRKRRFEKVIASEVLSLIRQGEHRRARKRVRQILFGEKVS